MSDAEIPYTRIPFDDMHTRDSKPSEVEQVTPAYKPEDLEREANSTYIEDVYDEGLTEVSKPIESLRYDTRARALFLAGAQAMRDQIEAKAERDVAVLAKENAERILQTLNQDDMRHQWIAMKTHREAEAKARLDAEAALTKAEARVKELEDALCVLYEETADYIKINQLGDVHHNQSMKLARAALQVKP